MHCIGDLSFDEGEPLVDLIDDECGAAQVDADGQGESIEVLF